MPSEANSDGETMTQNIPILWCFLLLAVLPSAAVAQEAANTSSQATDAAKAQPKTKAPPKSNPEAESNTSAGTEALQKATQNPVASLISVPVQNNSNFGVDPGNRTQDVLNIQPVVPIDLSKNWNLVIRWISPIVWQPLPNQPSTPETGVYGLGDMQPTFFLV